MAGKLTLTKTKSIQPSTSWLLPTVAVKYSEMLKPLERPRNGLPPGRPLRKALLNIKSKLEQPQSQNADKSMHSPEKHTSLSLLSLSSPHEPKYDVVMTPKTLERLPPNLLDSLRGTSEAMFGKSTYASHFKSLETGRNQLYPMNNPGTSEFLSELVMKRTLTEHQFKSVQLQPPLKTERKFSDFLGFPKNMMTRKRRRVHKTMSADPEFGVDLDRINSVRKVIRKVREENDKKKFAVA